jgi:hypothetical protein
VSFTEHHLTRRRRRRQWRHNSNIDEGVVGTWGAQRNEKPEEKKKLNLRRRFVTKQIEDRGRQKRGQGCSEKSEDRGQRCQFTRTDPQPASRHQCTLSVWKKKTHQQYLGMKNCTSRSTKGQIDRKKTSVCKLPVVRKMEFLLLLMRALRVSMIFSSLFLFFYMAASGERFSHSTAQTNKEMN